MSLIVTRLMIAVEMARGLRHSIGSALGCWNACFLTLTGRNHRHINRGFEQAHRALLQGNYVVEMVLETAAVVRTYADAVRGTTDTLL